MRSYLDSLIFMLVNLDNQCFDTAGWWEGYLSCKKVCDNPEIFSFGTKLTWGKFPSVEVTNMGQSVYAAP